MSVIAHTLTIAQLFARLIPFVLCSILGVCYTSCNSSTTYTNPQQVVFPDSNVSYQRHVQPLMALGCAFAGCHNAGSITPLDSYFSIITTAGLVIPFQPAKSTLSQVVSGQLAHNYSLATIVTENHKKGIAKWIEEGAKNN